MLRSGIYISQCYSLFFFVLYILFIFWLQNNNSSVKYLHLIHISIVHDHLAIHHPIIDLTRKLKAIDFPLYLFYFFPLLLFSFFLPFIFGNFHLLTFQFLRIASADFTVPFPISPDPCDLCSRFSATFVKPISRYRYKN